MNHCHGSDVGLEFIQIFSCYPIYVYVYFIYIYTFTIDIYEKKNTSSRDQIEILALVTLFHYCY